MGCLVVLRTGNRCALHLRIQNCRPSSASLSLYISRSYLACEGQRVPLVGIRQQVGLCDVSALTPLAVPLRNHQLAGQVWLAVPSRQPPLRQQLVRCLRAAAVEVSCDQHVAVGWGQACCCLVLCEGGQGAAQLVEALCWLVRAALQVAVGGVDDLLAVMRGLHHHDHHVGEGREREGRGDRGQGTGDRREL